MNKGGRCRIRRSCERCRRKKVRCTAEKPSCSFCFRLNQACIYLPRSQIYGSPARDNGDARSERHLRSHASQATTEQNLNHRWSPSNPEPPAGALQHLVNTYREMIYFQPLPVINPQNLEEQLSQWPYYVRWSFFALALHYSTPPFYLGVASEARSFYASSSRGISRELSSEGVIKPEILQSLCLLTLCDILDDNSTRAWMTIGTLSRLEALRLLRLGQTLHQPTSNDCMSRCHWSIFLLEKLFTPTLTASFQTAHRPDFPKSAEIPAAIKSNTWSKSHCHDLSSNVEHDGSCPDLGINGSCIELASLWGDITAYLQDVRNGLDDCPWLSTSRHAKLSVAFYEYEVRVSSVHMLRWASFPDRPILETRVAREYWMPWLTMEVLYHASKAALDNPFVQLFALRGSTAKTQPGSYLQKAVDQALFNYEWIARLVEMAQASSFGVLDPSIGSAVAATATVPWLFQFARDEQVAQKAKNNLELFESFLGSLAGHWPQISRKLKTLRELKRLSSRRDASGAQSTTVRFRPGLVWDLLCPEIPAATATTSIDSSLGEGSPREPEDATLHVTTQYMHPLIDSAASPALDFSNMEMLLNRCWEDFDGPQLDGFFSQTLLEGVF